VIMFQEPAEERLSSVPSAERNVGGNKFKDDREV